MCHFKGSHMEKLRPHIDAYDADNLLTRGQVRAGTRVRIPVGLEGAGGVESSAVHQQRCSQPAAAVIPPYQTPMQPHARHSTPAQGMEWPYI